jgi:hypothetical protein
MGTNLAKLALSIILLTAQIGKTAEVGQSADEALAQYEAGVQAKELKGKIPAVIICGGETLYILKALEEKNFLGVWLSHEGSSVALVVPEDGEQEHGYFVQTSDLLELKLGHLSQVSANTFSGYWWADGDHGTFGEPVQCTLPFLN